MSCTVWGAGVGMQNIANDWTVNEDAAQLLTEGHCLLRDFIQEDLLQLLVAEAGQLPFRAWKNIFNNSRPDPDGIMNSIVYYYY